MTAITEIPPPGPFAVGVHPVVENAVTTELRGILERVAALGDHGGVGVGADADRVDQLGLLERVKGASAAAQARLTVGFQASQLAQQDAAGVRRDQRGRGIGDQVALARGCASSQGSRHLGFANAMREMPHTHALLTRGEITEWVATLLVRETAILTLEDRREVDQRLCAMTVEASTGEISEPRVVGMTPRQVENRSRALAAELDPEAAVKRASKGARDRRVTIRPAPDTMAYVTGLLPVAQGVACWANLKRTAEAMKAAGDSRTVSQITADLFVERLTGQATATAVPVEVGLVMTPDTLIGASERPARTAEGVVVPAQVARDLALSPEASVWLRRIFTDPVTGIVTTVDARRRLFASQDRRTIDHRDQVCRHPGCDSPIGDHDHVLRVADDGTTVPENAQGLCEGHNLVKEMPGWHSRVVDPRPGHHTVEVVTPTGHTYRSQAPPGLPPPL